MSAVRRYRPDDDPEEVRPARRRSATGFRCPYCRMRDLPVRRSRMTPAGAILFWLMLCSFLFTLFCWIPLVLMREEYRTCSQCGMKLG